jgi:hypothetical protein
MGTICSDSHRNIKINIRRNIPEKNLFKEYIYSCFIFKTNDYKTSVSGFFCKLRYPNPNIPVSIFITSKDSFPENFNFEDKYNISVNNNILNRFNFKTIYLSDNHNIVILQIWGENLNLNNISFLEIDNFDYRENINNFQFYSYNLLKNGNYDISICKINEVNKKDYTFEYPNNENKDIFKYALLLNNNINKLVGTNMKKGSNKGILIIGIINEIQKNQINNKVNNILNNNENSIDEDIDNFGYEENKTMGNLNSLQIVSNDVGKLSRKNISKINQNNDDKNNGVHFENNKKDISNINNNLYEYKKNEDNDKNNKDISLYFVFNNGKELYLDVKESYKFEQVIEELNEKYLWLKNIKIKDYKINSTSIIKNKTVKENKLVDESTINIIE